MQDNAGIGIQSISLGKGLVSWKAAFPPLSRKNQRLTGEYQSLNDLLDDLRQFCSEDQIAPQVLAMMNERKISGEWGSGL